MEWAELGGADEDLIKGQLVHADMRDFLDRWQGKTGIDEVERVLSSLRPLVEKIGRVLESKYLEALRDLLEQRHTVLIAPLIFEGGIAMLGLIKHSPESLRPGFHKIFRESMGYDFDAERYFRENESDMDDYTVEYNQALAKMEVTWPERFNAETRARLAHAEIEEINAWKAEVTTQVEAALGDINKKASR
jgi:hypothetical protein